MGTEIKKIFFFIDYPFSKRDYERFGIEILQQNGFDVEVWDFTPFLNSKVYREVTVPDPINNYEKYLLFLTKEEAISAISKLTTNCIVICLVDYNFNSHPVFRTLSKNKLKSCVFMANALPFSNNKNKVTITKIFKEVKKITYSKIVNFVFSRIPYAYVGINPVFLILAGGEKSVSNRYPISSKTEILWLHTLDYDIYLKEGQTPVQVDNKIGVFLDEYLPFHPDYTYMGVQPFITPEEYYPLLCRFFDFLEKNYGFNIVIAAHPRSDYEKHPDFFGGRPIIKGKTGELVKKSGFVITHSSTSINFAVLFKKPVIFITTERLKHGVLGPLIDEMALWLGKRAIDLNGTFTSDLKKELFVNEEAYRNYKNSYIKKDGTEELHFWQIFANRIKLLK